MCSQTVFDVESLYLLRITIISGELALDSGTIALFIASLVGLLEVVSIWVVNRKIDAEHRYMEERGTVGEQFGGWLVGGNLDDNGEVIEGAPTNLQVLTDMVVGRFIEHQKFSMMQEASVDSRIQNKYNVGVVEGLQKKMPIGWKFVIKAAEYLGFDIEEIMEKGELTQFVQALQKNEIGMLMGEMNPSSGEKRKSGVFNIG